MVAVANVATCFLYDEGAWRLPKSDLFGSEAMMTQHTQEQACLEDRTARKKSSPKRKGVVLVKRPKLVRDALQQVTAATRERQTHATLGKAAMIAMVVRKSGPGAECLIGARLGNHPVLRICTWELRYVRTARLQELLGVVHPAKQLARKANRFLAIVTKTSVDSALGVERPRTYPGPPPQKSEAERAPKK